MKSTPFSSNPFMKFHFDSSWGKRYSWNIIGSVCREAKSHLVGGCIFPNPSFPNHTFFHFVVCFSSFCLVLVRITTLAVRDLRGTHMGRATPIEETRLARRSGNQSYTIADTCMHTRACMHVHWHILQHSLHTHTSHTHARLPIYS